MAKISIPCLVAKKTAAGIRWYWQPSATLKRAGWKPVALGLDQAGAIRAAQARNEEVAAWRGGGHTPRQIDRMAKRATLAALIKRYRAERLPALAGTTQETYGAALKRLDAWGGATAAAAMTRRNVRVLRDAMVKGTVGPHAAHTALKVGRALFAWGKEQGLVEANPFEAFDLAAPDPRHQIWEEEDLLAFAEAAMMEGYPSMAYAVELAAWIGQREGDLIRLTERQYREITVRDAADRAALAGADGRVMGIELVQAKTRRPIGIPIADWMRDATEAAIAVNRLRGTGTMTLLVNDLSGLPWLQRHFITIFTRVKTRAVADGRAALADLQFRDLRRTCVVRLGRLGLNDAQISAISGHKLETTKRILETYMPRDTDMAASAIVATLVPRPKNVPVGKAASA